MSEFKYKFEDGEPQECDSCRSVAPLDSFRRGPPNNGERDLCELCAGSYVGNATEDHRNYENPEAMVTMAQIGNIILDKVLSRKPG